MKKIAKLSLCALAGAALTSCCTDKAASPGYVSREALASGFVTPPDSIQTSVYWYWISNASWKEGVVKDLGVDEKGRYQPGVHRQHRSGRRTLRQRQDAQ